MRIAVIGAGGVGGGFGAALAKAGGDVTFVARGAHLAAMKKDGLKIQGGRGETHIVPTKATDNPAEIGPVDIVLFCVKLWDVESAGERIKPLIGRGSAVIPLQNGIDAHERLLPIVGRDGKRSKRGDDLLALCQKAGFDVTLSEAILTELWMKFILLATNASITA